MDVGKLLQRARLAQSLSVAELAERTRIRPTLVEAIERNDFDACGGEVFARGHVRAMAQALGLDPVQLVEHMGGTAATSVLETVEPDSLNIWELKYRSHTPSESRTWLLLVAAGAVIVAIIGWLSLRSTPADDPAPSALLTQSALAEPTPTPTPTATPGEQATADAATPVESETAAVEGALVLTIDATESSWVRFTNADGTLFEGTLNAGDRRVLGSDSDVEVRVGNAAAIGITVNGEVYANLGGPGEVYAHTFTLDRFAR